MYSLVIIDDEPVFVRNICECIDFEKLDIEIIATAQNGDEGYELIKNNLPDIILCDIEMPVMTGFEMLDKIKDIPDYTPQIIMFTGFNEFEYAKKAISYKVVEYLVKPCMPDELIAALTIAKSACDRLRLNLDMGFTLNQTQTMILVNEIIHSNSYSHFELMDKQRKLGISLQSENYCLLRLRFVGDFPKNADNIRILSTAYTKEIENSFENVFHTNFNADHLYFLIPGINDIKTITEICKEKLIEKCSDDYRTYISVSNLCGNISDLPELLKQVMYCEKFSFCSNESKVLVYSIIKPYVEASVKSEKYIEYENNIPNKFLTNYEDFDRYVNYVNDFTKDFEYYDPDYFKTLIYNTMSLLTDTYSKSGKEIDLHTKSRIWDSIYKLSSVSELADFFNSIKAEFKNVFEIPAELRHSIISDQIKIFIQNNYMEKNLIADIAKMFYLSDRRLRDIFMIANDIGLSEYIRIFRMQKAFELLKTSKLSIQEIGKNVGYSNPLRFRQAFTEFYGKAPSEFVEKHDKKK